MNANEIKTKLTEMGGKLWEKGNMSRIYFDMDLVIKNAGLKISYYNSGNIAGATLNGETISNSDAKRILSALQNCKLWYDFGDAQFHIKDQFNDLVRFGNKSLITAYIKTLTLAIA